MLTRKKSIKSRSRRARRKRSKFITPDLVLVAGKLMRHVSSPDNPLSAAERLRGEYAQMEAGHDAEVRQFLQRAYFVAAQFRWRLGDFERFQVHPFWKQSGMKPNDPATSKWLLYLIMEATTPNLRQLADKYAAILDGLKQDQVEIDAVAARIQSWAASTPLTKPCRCGSAATQTRFKFATRSRPIQVTPMMPKSGTTP